MDLSFFFVFLYLYKNPNIFCYRMFIYKMFCYHVVFFIFLKSNFCRILNNYLLLFWGKNFKCFPYNGLIKLYFGRGIEMYIKEMKIEMNLIKH